MSSKSAWPLHGSGEKATAEHAEANPIRSFGSSDRSSNAHTTDGIAVHTSSMTSIYQIVHGPLEPPVTP